MPPEPGQTYFSTDISPALLRKMDKRQTDEVSPRVGLGRKFLSIIGMEKKEPSRSGPGASKKNIPHLSKEILGPYAYEVQMPSDLYQRLQDGPKITRTKKISRHGGLVVHESVDGETPGVLPILKRLIEHDHRHAKHPSSVFFPGRTPGILDLQDHIEQAWDNGRHPYARQEVGRLKGTRKWIGTLEVHAIYQNLDIPCKVNQFSDSNTTFADEGLLDWVQAYFESAAMPDNKKVNSHHSSSPDVYAFFDVSTGHYEVYRTDAFHRLFPWYLYGAKFEADQARFERHPVMRDAIDVSLWRGFCVPQLFSRWIPGEDGTLEITKLSYDDWMLPDVAEIYELEYWNPDTSVMDTSVLDHSYWTLPIAADISEPEYSEFDESWMDTSGIVSPACPEFEQLKEELLDCGYDLPPYSELRSLREEFLRCGSGGLWESPPVHEFKEKSVSTQVSNKDGWACLNAKHINEFVPGLQYVPSAGLAQGLFCATAAV
ncbi:hypothetical protein BLS_000608 [Venturia inaequalis]|uniref:UFSP1/2/DUB catalytic domain-containing protein n=1 Tax=Venturia inaequalis TaxID=5025 RepID=A0A8H3V181_VENIN|nr:hypothetical protein BLS_000608 [Venturia inaequalis]